MWWHLGELPQVGNEARVVGLCQVHEGSFVFSDDAGSLAHGNLAHGSLAHDISVLGRPA